MSIQQKRYLLVVKSLAIIATLYVLSLYVFDRFFADVSPPVGLIVAFVSICTLAPILLFNAVVTGRLDRFIKQQPNVK